jgi:hypothetical protein
MGTDNRHRSGKYGLIALIVATLNAVVPAQAQERTRTNSVGGPGGSAFAFDCPPNTYMTGLRARQGAWIDAVAAECSTYNTSSQRFDAAKVSRNFGGNGGEEGAMRCARPRGVIVGLEIMRADNEYASVGHIIVNCGDLFDPQKFANKGGGSAPYLGQATAHRRSTITCPPNHVAAGIHGKHGVYVDRLGLTCAKKPFTLGAPQRAGG